MLAMFSNMAVSPRWSQLVAKALAEGAQERPEEEPEEIAMPMSLSATAQAYTETHLV